MAKKSLPAAIAGFTAALCATIATAQSGVMEEVIVTAQKREQSINDIPLAITALSGEQLRDRGIETAADLSRIVAGFTYADTGVNAPVYSLRGVGYFDYSLAAAPAVSVYLDEVALPYAAMTQGTAIDIERVEVLRGPQGTLFGQNATGGLVNYIARKPTDSFEAGVEAGYSRFNRRDLEGYLSGPLGANTRGRIAFQTQDSDEWQSSYTRDDSNGALDQTSARAMLDWDVSDTLTATFNLNGYLNKSDPLATQVIAITPLTPARIRSEVRDHPLAPEEARAADWSDRRAPHRDDRFWQASLRLDWQLASDTRVTSISAYSDLDTDDYIDRDGMPNDNSQYGLAGAIESFNQELRLSGEQGLLTYVAGVSYQSTDTLEQQTVSIESASNVQNTFGVKFSDASNRIENELSSLAFFASGDWALADDITLTTGLRHTKSTMDFAGCASLTEPAAIQAFSNISAFFRNLLNLPATPFTLANNNCATLGADFLAVEPQKSLDEDNLSWRLALGWDISEDTLLYLSASRGYKAGNSITVAGSSSAQYEPVNQEELTSFEAGFKAQLLARSMQLNGSLFQYDYKHKQTRSKIVDPVFGPLQALVNIPESKAWGGELEMQWLPLAGLAINAGTAYLDTEIEKFNGFDALGATRDFSGQPFSFAPEWQFNLDLDYRWSLGRELLAFAGAGVTHHSATTADFDSNPLFDIDAYTLVDLRAGVESADGRWQVTAWGRNVTDEYYWQSVIRVQDSVVRVAGMPATYGVAAAYRF